MPHEPIFLKALEKNGSYQTPEDVKRSAADRLLGWTDAYYYYLLYRVVAAGRRCALKKQFDKQAWARHSWMVFDMVERCGGRLELEGYEHVRQTQPPVVFACNHMSLLETFLMPGLLVPHHGLVATVVKQSLTTYPVFGHIMRAVDPICVARENPREDLKTVLDEGRQAIKEGRSVLLFPQHTRHLEFRPRTFNSLAVKLASRMKIPVLPVAVKTDFMGIGRFVRDFGKIRRKRPVHVGFGEPIDSSDPRQAQKLLVEFIANRYRDWGGEVLEDE